jgi:hypothetical protein
MIGQDVMLAAVLQNEERVTVRGNYQHCYHRGCQEKSANGIEMKTHLEMKHHSASAPDMGAWDIILDHLTQNENLTLADFFGEKKAFACKHKGCGFIGITEKAMTAHNTQQHQAEAAWERALIVVQLGVAGPPEGAQDVVTEFNSQHEAFMARKDMTLEEAEGIGIAWREKSWDEFESGVKEKHPSRAEVKRINEEGSFPKMIKEDIVPYGQKFENCSSEAQDGYFEMAWQIQRAKLRALRKAGGTMFGPRRVTDSKEIERRRAVEEQAQVMYEPLKSTQLVLDVINWRLTDKRLAETEYQQTGIELDDARVRFEREREEDEDTSQVDQTPVGTCPTVLTRTGGPGHWTPSQR